MNLTGNYETITIDDSSWSLRCSWYKESHHWSVCIRICLNSKPVEELVYYVIPGGNWSVSDSRMVPNKLNSMQIANLIEKRLISSMAPLPRPIDIAEFMDRVHKLALVEMFRQFAKEWTGDIAVEDIACIWAEEQYRGVMES